MKTGWFSVLLPLFALDAVGAQCCIGLGPTLPSNTASSCVNSTSVQAIPAEWSFLPASGATSCASQGVGYSCLAFKCSISATGMSMTLYGQGCTTPAILSIDCQEADTELPLKLGYQSTVSCSPISTSDCSTKHPGLIVVLLLVAGNALSMTML